MVAQLHLPPFWNGEFRGHLWQEWFRNIHERVKFIEQGKYTPTYTNVTNLDASSPLEHIYIRIGNAVIVAGGGMVNPTAAASTELGVSLPIPSNFGAVEDLAGTATWSAVAQESAAFRADTTNDRASLLWVATDISNRAISYIFMYEVI